MSEVYRQVIWPRYFEQMGRNESCGGRELATDAARISDRELRQQLSHAAVQLDLADDVSQLAQVIDRLVRFRMVRTSVTDPNAEWK